MTSTAIMGRPRWAERLRWSTDPNWGTDLPDWFWNRLWPLYERPMLRGLCLWFRHGENFYGRCVYCGKPQPRLPMHGVENDSPGDET